MNYDFDAVIDRRGTNALAKEGFRGYLFDGQGDLNLTHAEEDLISMWVADMAFAAPPAATQAMIERIKHPIFGYTMNFEDSYFQAFRAWAQQRYGWSFDKDTLVLSSGVIPALFDLIEYVCRDGEKVLTFTPAYGYFKHAADHHGITLETSALIQENGNFHIDFEDFRSKVSDPDVRLLFLCHPHNPTGRIWTPEELARIGRICQENNVIIVSDEVHCDLLRYGRTHMPLAKLFPHADHIITCMAPSKTFNLAGLMVANVIIPDPSLRELWQSRQHPFINPVSMAAALGVYTNGHDWLNALRSYLDANFKEVEATLKSRLPKAVFTIPDATYLAWIDVGAYFPAGTNLTRFFIEKAGVILEGGEMFISNAQNRIRLNVACPRSQLEEGLKRITDAILAFEKL